MPSPATTPAAPMPTRVLVAGLLPASLQAALESWMTVHGLVSGSLQVTPLNRVALRSDLPELVIMVPEPDTHDAVLTALRGLKSDARLQTIPAVLVATDNAAADWLEASADDVVSPDMHASMFTARLTAAVRRSRRDVEVNPSTRLAGADALAMAMLARIERAEPFAACYADLDHFKEFNDRYGYAMGDHVIRSIAQLLVGTVEGVAGERGFVGHIGGDDFLFLVPLDLCAETCDLLVQQADELLPQRYSAPDRQAGYFFGKDRRGRLDRVPLMTLSIGVVTNERRRFTSAAQISELATAMKAYAKSLPGSVWALDRRCDDEPSTPPEEKQL